MQTYCLPTVHLILSSPFFFSSHLFSFPSPVLLFPTSELLCHPMTSRLYLWRPYHGDITGLEYHSIPDFTRGAEEEKGWIGGVEGWMGRGRRRKRSPQQQHASYCTETLRVIPQEVQRKKWQCWFTSALLQLS